MITANFQSSAEPKLAKVLRDDFRRGGFKRTLSRDWSELKEFYLDQDRKSRLQQMGKFKRWLYMLGWLLKSLFLRLTPVRRILLLISFWLIIQSGLIRYEGENVQIENDVGKIGFVVVLFILMLELKDKLLAQSELAAGRSVQRALMPPLSPKVPGWDLWLLTRPANEVGGDLVDFLAIDKNRFGVALGDVAGKGLKAALLMAKLQSTLRALATEFTSLAELGARLNAILRRDGLPDSFASLVYIELQADSASVRLLNAGHMPPLILKGGMVEETQHGGAAIGVISAATFNEQQLELRRGDVLVVYSDGLTEAINEAGDFFGDQRLLKLLPLLSGLAAPEIGQRILAEVDHFVGEARAHDDLSLVVLIRAA
jgi:serine phosphatase RsbU (regulator of sigma subunit)